MTVQTVEVPKPNPPRFPSAEDALALRVRYERIKRGWSTEELARRMGEAGVPINQSAIWRIENATPRRKIGLDEAIGFAKVFDVDLGDLIGSRWTRAAAEQILNLVDRMREASDELRTLRRQLVLIVAAVAQVPLSPEYSSEEWAAAPEAAAELVRELVREFPWIEEPGS